MSDIIKSQGWNWNIVSGGFADVWKKPASESFYLMARWKQQSKKKFLRFGLWTGAAHYFICL